MNTHDMHLIDDTTIFVTLLPITNYENAETACRDAIAGSAIREQIVEIRPDAPGSPWPSEDFIEILRGAAVQERNCENLQTGDLSAVEFRGVLPASNRPWHVRVPL